MKYGEPRSSQQQKYPIPQKSDHQVPNMLQLVLIDRQLLFSISFSDYPPSYSESEQPRDLTQKY